MFEQLSDRLSAVFSRLSGRGKLSESDVNEALREVRVALLEADVSLAAAKQFVNGVKEKAIGQNVLESLTPAQTWICTAAMLLGRLEIFSVIVLFTRTFWRK